MSFASAWWPLCARMPLSSNMRCYPRDRRTRCNVASILAPCCNTGTCPTPKERIYTELQYNIDLMEGKPVTPNRQLYKHAHKTEANAFVCMCLS
jgi:hypothetical protein